MLAFVLIKEIHELGIVIVSLPKTLRTALRIKSKILNVPDKTLHNLASVLGSRLISWNCPSSPRLGVPGLTPATSLPASALVQAAAHARAHKVSPTLPPDGLPTLGGPLQSICSGRASLFS